MQGVRLSPAPSNNFALVEPRATVNFLIHDGKYPLCFRSALRRWPENAKKKPLDFAVPPAELLPGNRSCYRKRRIGDRVANTLYVQQKVLARTGGRDGREGGREGVDEEGKKAIGKIRRNCAPVDTPAPVSWK